MDFIEVSAKTVDEAITKACIDLGISSDRLDIQVVSQGSSGFLGFGSKPAVIKVRKKEEEVVIEEPVKVEAPAKPKKEKVQKAEEKPVKKEAPAEKHKPERSEKPERHEKPAKAEREPQESRPARPEKADRPERSERPEKSERPERSERPSRGDRPNRDRNGRGPRRDNRDNRKDYRKDRDSYAKKEPVKKEQQPVVPKKEFVVTPKTEEEVAAMKTAADNFLKGVFRVMELPVEIHMDYVADAGCLEINFDGADMGVLIGKRGQTLDSLQYLTSLVVNKEQKDYVRVKLDTEDYRKRRKDTLENLAKNIAYKVKRTRKPVSLEPMNPYERRIIHSALQSNKFVETYSEGNEPYRHIVVTLKK